MLFYDFAVCEKKLKIWHREIKEKIGFGLNSVIYIQKYDHAQKNNSQSLSGSISRTLLNTHIRKWNLHECFQGIGYSRDQCIDPGELRIWPLLGEKV